MSAIPAIRVRGLEVAFGERKVMDGLDLDVWRGEVLGFVGASGAGKSVLTRTLLGLQPKQAGTIEVDGRDLDAMSPRERGRVERGWGVLFQQGALFSSLTVRQNVEAPMREHLDISPALRAELAMLKLRLVGLPPDAGAKFPSELSGGMIKRAALARALALDPGVLFLDEPTSGLDPISAGEFDTLIATLQATLGLTVFMVTHDLDSLYAICDRVAVLGGGKVSAIGTIAELLQIRGAVDSRIFPRRPRRGPHPHGPRPRADVKGVQSGPGARPVPQPECAEILAQVVRPRG